MTISDTIDTYIVPLRRMENSPDSTVFWSGRVGNSELYFCTNGRPSDHQLQFAAGIIADLESLESEARRFLAVVIRASPEKFGIDGATAECIYQKSDAELPFDIPECTFYPDDHWQVRFASGRYLPAFESFGVAVEFNGREPVRAFDLSESEPLE